MNIEQMRQAFEEMCQRDRPELSLLRWDMNGEYASPETKQAWCAWQSMAQGARIPAGLYAELEALRQLRDSVQEYAKRYMRDEIEDEDLCATPEQHDLACTVSLQLQAAFAAEWKGSASA